MYSRARLGLKYFNYLIAATNAHGHGMHSPFVFEFITKVLNDTTRYPDYELIETWRKKLLADNHSVQVTDLGAGGRDGSRKISEIARLSLKPKKYAQLLYRIARFYKPASIIELGTSLGITTAYLSKASAQTPVVTIEGDSNIASVARQNFEELGLKNIDLLTGNFEDRLPEALGRFPEPGLVFIDGNHRKEPTLSYFNLLMHQFNNDSILIFDDIHWSKEMELAWEEIKKDERVQATIDLFFIGIVLFRKEFREKQHFLVRF
jgi:predicted O-methyltransferase YrrM